jgi:7-cyano-7-deazaguanine reductase
MSKPKLKALGKKVTKFEGLEVFPAPSGIQRVICTSDEVTALCPVTGQPDWYIVKIDYIPQKLCVESKTLKLYLQSFRQQGHFCERFSSIIAHQILKTLEPLKVSVTVTQKPRGGIAIEATTCL